MATISVHPHPVQFISPNDPCGWACDGRKLAGGCRRGITDFHQTNGVPRYRCQGCDFDLCDVCVQAYTIQNAAPQNVADSEWEVDRLLGGIQTRQDLEGFLARSELSEQEKQQVRQEWDRNGRGTEGGGSERGMGKLLLGGAVAVGGIFLLKKLILDKPKVSHSTPGYKATPPPSYGAPHQNTNPSSGYPQPGFNQNYPPQQPGFTPNYPPQQGFPQQHSGYPQSNPAYNPNVGSGFITGQPKDLKVTVVRCSNLKDTDTFGKSDPYVILEVHGQKQISTTKNNDLNPVYNETFLFRNVEHNSKLQVTVKDKDTFSDDKVGHGSINIHDLPRGQERELTISLGYHGIMFHKATCTLRLTYH